MIPIKTKEHLIYFMQCGMMRLSKYDLRFVQNLQALTLQHLKLTSNQVMLFDKLVYKYRKQLLKHGLTQDQLTPLVWETSIVASDPKFTEAFVSIENETIIFRAPFSKKFIDEFRKIQNNSFTWVKDRKVYESPFSTQSLKYLLEVANNVYPVVNYCPVLARSLNRLETFASKYWNPTLVKCNDQYLIAASNAHLDLAIRDIKLSNDPVCLSMLTSYGVKIDDSIIGNDPILKFASEFSPALELMDIDTISKNLLAINCDAIFIGGRSRWATQYKEKLEEKIKGAGLYIDDRIQETVESRLEGKNNPVLLYMSPGLVELSHANSRFRKVIKLKNSMPVVVK
jgi:hypothetical protein